MYCRIDKAQEVTVKEIVNEYGQVSVDEENVVHLNNRQLWQSIH